MNPSPKDTGKRPAEFTIGIEAHPEYIELDLISHNNALASGEVYNLIDKSAYELLERKLAKAVEQRDELATIFINPLKRRKEAVADMNAELESVK
jgi:hypothetical protein